MEEQAVDERAEGAADGRRGREVRSVRERVSDDAVEAGDHALLKEREVKLVLAAGEVVVDRPLPELGPLGDLLHGRPGVPLLGEHGEGGVEHGLAAGEALALAAAEVDGEGGFHVGTVRSESDPSVTSETGTSQRTPAALVAPRCVKRWRSAESALQPAVGTAFTRTRSCRARRGSPPRP